MSRNGANRRPTKGQAGGIEWQQFRNHLIQVDYKRDEDVKVRVKYRGLTYRLFSAKLSRSTRHVNAFYRLAGES